MSEMVSGRALAAALGVSESAVRKAEKAGRITKGADGLFDVDVARAAWSSGSARDERPGADLAANLGSQFAVRTHDAPLGFEALRALLKDQTLSAERLAAAVAGARQAERDAQADVARFEAERRSQLTADDAVRTRTREALLAARERVEDANLFVVEFEKRYAAAVQAEQQDERLTMWTAAKAKADAAAKLLAEEYGPTCHKVLGLLRTLAEAQLAVQQTNAGLPAGAEPLVDPEQTIRGIPGLARKVIRESVVELWCREGEAVPLGDDLQKKVQSTGTGQGVIPSPPRQYPVAGQLQFDLRQFSKVEYLPETYGTYPQTLETTLRLPGLLASDPPFFSPMPFAFDRPNPAAVITEIDEALSQPRGAAPADRTPQIQYVLIDGSVAA